MACIRRENTGSCEHYQCPFKDETPHGYECVDLLFGTIVSFCEVGENCLEKCPYSFVKDSGSDVEKSAIEWSKNMDQELKQYHDEYKTATE